MGLPNGVIMKTEFKIIFLLAIFISGIITGCQQSDNSSSDDNGVIIAKDEHNLVDEEAIFDTFEDNICVISEPKMGVPDFFQQSVDFTPFTDGEPVKVHLYVKNDSEMAVIDVAIEGIKLISEEMIGEECETVYRYTFPVARDEYSLSVISESMGIEEAIIIDASEEVWIYLAVGEDGLYYSSQNEQIMFM